MKVYSLVNHDGERCTISVFLTQEERTEYIKQWNIKYYTTRTHELEIESPVEERQTTEPTYTASITYKQGQYADKVVKAVGDAKIWLQDMQGLAEWIEMKIERSDL